MSNRQAWTQIIWTSHARAEPLLASKVFSPQGASVLCAGKDWAICAWPRFLTKLRYNPNRSCVLFGKIPN